MDNGIVHCRRWRSNPRLSDRLSEDLNLRVWQAEDPLTCVCRGTGLILEDFDQMQNYLVSLERGSTRHAV
jgi:rod shape-determining protein MreB